MRRVDASMRRFEVVGVFWGRKCGLFSPTMQRQKRNHALRRAEPCTCASPTMQVAERNHALSRVHGSARAFPSIETFFSFLTWVLAQRAIATPMSFGVSKRILQSPCKRFRGNLSFPKRWDNFAPSQSQTLLQAKRELDFKFAVHFKSNPRFTSSGNGGSLKAKRRHRLGGRFWPLLQGDF